MRMRPRTRLPATRTERRDGARRETRRGWTSNRSTHRRSGAPRRCEIRLGRLIDCAVAMAPRGARERASQRVHDGDTRSVDESVGAARRSASPFSRSLRQVIATTRRHARSRELRTREPTESSQAIRMRQNEQLPELLQHAFAVVSIAKFNGRHSHERPHVTAEALWRRIVEMVGDVRDGKSGILEQARRAHQPSHGEIALWAREAGRERSGSSACSAARRGGRTSMRTVDTRGGSRKSASKKRQQSCGTPARSSAKLPERLALDVFAARGEQIVAELAPPVGLADVDHLPHARGSEREHRVRRSAIELREQRDGGHARELAHERGDAGARPLVAARHRHEHGARLGST